MFCDVIFNHDQNWILFLIFLFHVFVICVLKNNCWFSFFIHSVRTDCKKWSWWNFFIKTNVSFFIIVYDFYVFCSYFSHLIRSLNCVNFVFHFMLSIESTKYRSFSLSIIMSCDNDTCLSIRLSFKNHNRLTWNIEWIFISDNNLSSYV